MSLLQLPTKRTKRTLHSLRWRYWLIVGASLWLSLVVIFLSVALFTTARLRHSISNESSKTFQTKNRLALQFWRATNVATFNLVPDVKFIITTLDFSNQNYTLISRLQTKTQDAQVVASLPSVEETQKIQEEILEICNKYQKTWLTRSLLKQQLTELDIQSLLCTKVPTSLAILENLVAKSYQSPVLVIGLLQNTHEIRATGGFMGSYALLTFEQGNITKIEIRDIYDAANQTTATIPTPEAIKQYLSGGENLALPDANWWPHFADSAEVINQLMAEANYQNIAIITAINSSLLSDVLATVGPITNPDTQEQITAENFHQLARANRTTFFPGDKQKVVFLEALTAQLQNSISQLDSRAIIDLVSIFESAIVSKELQFFSPDPSMQTQLIELNSTGALEYHSATQNILGWVESNVGINKANKNITRTRSLDFAPSGSSVLVTVEITNNNPILNQFEAGLNPDYLTANTLDYINYQRIYINPDAEIFNLAVNNQPVPSTKTNYQTGDNQLFSEIGFLLPIQAQSSSVITFELRLLDDASEEPHLLWWTQSGLDRTDSPIKTKLY